MSSDMLGLLGILLGLALIMVLAFPQLDNPAAGAFGCCGGGALFRPADAGALDADLHAGGGGFGAVLSRFPAGRIVWQADG